jgi:hypothetical protein
MNIVNQYPKHKYILMEKLKERMRYDEIIHSFL